MRYSTVMSHLAKEYEHALVNPLVRKPLSFALYRTWKWCDTYEKPKEKERENGR